jgi:hypothetical protein
MRFVSFALVGVFLFSLFASQVSASTYTSGYYRRSGTYVQPYYRSNSNNTRFDNYSTRGNYNPYTGSKGYTSTYTVPTYKSYSSPSYGTYRSYRGY